MQMVGRKWQAGDYRYGFNGKENDNEVKGEGNQQDYGMRIYDTRLGRFLSVDPISKSYPSLTPYQFASNSPIKCVDVDGLEGDPVRGAIDWVHEQWEGLTSAERWTEAVTNVNETVNPIYFVANYGSKILTNKDLRGRPNDHRGRLGAASDFVAEGMMAWALGRTLGSYGTNTLEAEINTFSSSARLSKKMPSSPSQPALQISTEEKQKLIAFVKQESSSGTAANASLHAVEEDGFAVVRDGLNNTVGKGWLHQGELNLSIKTRGSDLQGRGSDVFRILHDFVVNNFDNINAIRGTWRPEMASNLNRFNELLKQGKSLTEAAFGTFTGSNARALGFTNVEVLPSSVKGSNGVYEAVDILFKK